MDKKIKRGIVIGDLLGIKKTAAHHRRPLQHRARGTAAIVCEGDANAGEECYKRGNGGNKKNQWMEQIMIDCLKRCENTDEVCTP